LFVKNVYPLKIFRLIIFNPWAAGMISLIVLSMTMELAGFMGWSGVKVDIFG
jgi:uncharacterized membrane protein YdfJ with MMPL/SSD domain